jgi:hypothetical protein
VTDPHALSAPPGAQLPALRFTATATNAESSPAPGGDGPLALRLCEIETRIERLAERFDQLEFVIVEQFEPGMTPAGDLPHGNLRERLDRIEAVLGLLSQGREERPAYAPVLAAGEAQVCGLFNRLSDDVAAQAQRSDAVESRLDGIVQALDAVAAEARIRSDALLAALEGAMRRPMPAPDLTMQHRSFAGFATALQVTLDRLDDAAARILGGFATVTGRLDALEARITPADRPSAAADPGAGDVATALGALCERIGALTGALAVPSQRTGEPDIGALTMRLDALGAVLSASVEDAVQGNRAAMEETLRDLRLAVAEIAAENHRLRIA